jgi:hypothetical protein
VFVSVDGGGRLSVWNVCQDEEVPVAGTDVSKHALSCLRWTRDGRKVVVGDYAGETVVYEVSEEVCLSHAEELVRFEQKILSAIHATSEGA